MTMGRPQGLVILVIGLLLLAGGILVLIAVPSWGEWIASYPAQITQTIQQLPQQTAPIAQGIGGIFGPLLEQVGGYLQKVGYFVGSLLILVSLVITSGGAMVIKRASS